METVNSAKGPHQQHEQHRHEASLPTRSLATDSTVALSVTNQDARSSTAVLDAHQPPMVPSTATLNHPPTSSPSASKAPEQPFNPIPVSKACKININLFEYLLQKHPDQNLVKYIVNGLRNGFNIGFTGEFSATRPKNLKSADQDKILMQQAINKEITRGHTAGPFPYPPFPQTHCSPIGSAPKKDGSLRLVMDLSQPFGSSINDYISKEDFICEYSRFDDATDLVMNKGPNALMCKLDIKHAYRILPVQPDQWHLLCYYWENNYYVDLVLPFGLRSSGAIFNQFAGLVKWILIHHYHVENIVNYSDDFFKVCSEILSMAKPELHNMIQAFHDLDIPLAEDKIEGPIPRIIYLGIIINSMDMSIEVPEEKYVDSMTLLKKWKNRRTCTKRQLKSLIGKLGHIAKVVRPGRMFSRRLIDLSKTVKRMHHHITLNKEARADIQWWLDFLPHWTSKTMIPPSLKIYSTDLKLHTDASDIGFGAIMGTEWICGSWDTSLPKTSIDYRELFAITAAALTWGHAWTGQRVVFITDNKPITQVWDTGTSPSIPLMSLIRPLYLFAAKIGFSVSFKHIFGASNPVADALSRFQMEKFFSLMPEAAEEPTELPHTVTNLLAQTYSTS